MVALAHFRFRTGQNHRSNSSVNMYKGVKFIFLFLTRLEEVVTALIYFLHLKPIFFPTGNVVLSLFSLVPVNHELEFG
jgi:hypothetical protein